MSIIRSLIGPREKALTIDDVGAIMRAGGYVAQPYSTTIQNPREEIPADFLGMAYGIYKANPIAFRAMVVRMQVFAQARFRFQQIRDGQAGKTFGKSSLDILDHPEPTLSTADMLKRASVHADIAGNWFGVRRPDRIKTVRPDYCYLVLGSTARGGELGDVDTEVLGLIHTPGGLYSGNTPESFATGEYAHYAPIPDPIASYRGMSWLTTIIREVQGDQLMSVHKNKFLELGATPNIAVKFAPGMTQDKAKEFAEMFEQDHTGAYNAYRTIYLAAGSDVTVVGSNLQQMDFKAVQGATETRIAVASGVPAVLLGISEGLQGSSLNAGNYEAAKQSFSDIVVRDMWQDMCGCLETIVPPPPGSRLWYDEDQIPILRVDVEKAANVINQKATAMRTLWDGGAEPDSVILAVTSGDLTQLKHTGQPSVQLQETAGAAPTETEEPVEEEPTEEQKEAARLRIIEEWSYSPSQPRKNDGKFGSGGGGGKGSSGATGSSTGSGGGGGSGPSPDGAGPEPGTGGKPIKDISEIADGPSVPPREWGKGPTQTPEDAYATLVGGKPANIKAEDIPKILKIADEGDNKTADLTDLQVSGTLDFGGDGLGVPRAKMPQFADQEGNNYLPEYITHVAEEKGWKVESGTTQDPHTIAPTQKEVSIKKVGMFVRLTESGEMNRTAEIVIAQDPKTGEKHVIDGHHGWATATAMKYGDKSVTLKATVIHAPGREVVVDALNWTDKKGVARQSLSTGVKSQFSGLVAEYAMGGLMAPSAVVEEPFALFSTVLEMATLEVRCPQGHLLAEAATPPYRFTCSRCKAVVAEAGRWAVTTDPKVVVYSPSQPRRNDGKFGSGGGATPSGGSTGSGNTPSSIDPTKPYDPRNPPPLPVGIDTVEAMERLIAASPSLAEPTPPGYLGGRIMGLDLLDAPVRQQFVEGIEMSTKASDPRLGPTSIRVENDEDWKANGGGTEGAYVQYTTIHVRASAHGTPEMNDRYARLLGSGRYPGVPSLPGMTTTREPQVNQAKLPRSAMGEANAAGLSPMHYSTIHEMGHVVDHRSKDGPLARPTQYDADGDYMVGKKFPLMPPASQYGVRIPSGAAEREPERWAEGFVHHVAGLDTPPAKYVRDRLAGLRGKTVRRGGDVEVILP